MITITKNGKEAQIVESSLHVWKAKGWSVKSSGSTTQQKTGTKESATG